MGERRRGVLEMAAAMSIAGTIGWFAIRAGRPAPEIVFWRCLFAALVLGPYCAFTGAFRVRLSRSQWAIVLLGGAALVGNWVLLFTSYRHASVAIATAVYNVQPFLLLGIGVFLFGERPGASVIAGLGLAFLGMFLIVGTNPQAAYLQGGFGIGIGLALGAALGWAIAAAAAKRLRGVPPQLIAFVHVCMGAIVLALCVQPASRPTSLATWSLLASMGVVHTALMFVLMYAAVQRLSTQLQGALTFINPVVAVFVDMFALGHSMRSSQILGIAIVLCAAAMLTLTIGRGSTRSPGSEVPER